MDIILGLLTPEERDEIIINFHETREAIFLFLLEDLN